MQLTPNTRAALLYTFCMVTLFAAAYLFDAPAAAAVLPSAFVVLQNVAKFQKR